MLIKFLLGILFCELITELVIKSEIFESFRGVFTSRKNKNWFYWYIGSILSCGYCFSVYSGIFSALLLKINLMGYGIIGIIFSGLIIHRCSNILHNLIDKYTNKYYDLRFRQSDDIIIEGDSNE